MGVMVGHIFQFHENLPAGFWGRFAIGTLDVGALGVPLFFVISGFCIHLSWARKAAASAGLSEPLDEAEARRVVAQTPAPAFGSFWKRRFRRLYPPYLAGKSTLTIESYPEPRGRWMLWDFVLHLFMLHGFHPSFNYGGGNAVYWTLAREEFFYLGYFPLLAARRRWGLVPCLIGLSLLSVVFPVALGFGGTNREGGGWANIVHTSVPTLWIQWALGMASVEAYFGLIRLPSWAGRPRLGVLWLGLGVGSRWGLQLNPHLGLQLAEPLCIGLGFWTLLNWGVRREQAGVWQPSSPRLRALAKWLAATGVISYSIYLTHQPARAALRLLSGSIGASTQPLIFFGVSIAWCLGAYGVWDRFLQPGRAPLPQLADEGLVA